MAIDDDFWNYSSELALVRQYAHYHVGGPWAYLGAVMARAVTAIPYNVVLPDIIGSPVSVGMYIAFTGDPGQGKNSSASGSERLMPCDIHVAKPGSGEGLTSQFAYREKGSDEIQWKRRSVLFESGEAETLGALFSRSSSTLAGEFRSAWMAERIGFGYKNDLILPALSYRLSMSAYFTPSMGNVLLNGISEGTPQRFLFLPVNDPEMPEEEDVHRPRKQLKLNIPSVDEDELVEIDVPGWIKRLVRDAHRAKNRRMPGGLSDEELLDQHFNLVRLKVAFALGLILNPHRNDYVIAPDDWELSQYVMDKHHETRGWLITAAEEEGHKKDRKEGKSLGVRFAASDEVRRVGPVSDRIMNILVKSKKGKSDGWIAGGKLRNMLSTAQREHFDDVISTLESQGKVESAATVITANNRVLGRRFRAR